MARRLKVLTGLTALAGVSAIALVGCGEGEGEGEGAEHGVHAESGGAESEGAESEGEGAKSAAKSKPAFLSKLMIIEGHLTAGTDLYADGDNAMAATHMKHPQDEVYADLLPVFATYNASGFADELTALAEKTAAGASIDEVAAAFDAMKTAIGAAAVASEPSAKDRLLAAALTLSVAGEEFDIGVKEGRIVNVHEYQDAYGFLTATLSMLSGLKGETKEENDAIAVARAEAAKALQAAPSALPPANVKSTSEVIFGAAARIEIAAGGL